MCELCLPCWPRDDTSGIIARELLPQVLSLNGNRRLQLRDEGMAVLQELRLLRELSVRKGPPEDAP